MFRSKLVAAACAVAVLTLIAQSGSRVQAQSEAPLHFFKSYFVTGDYAAAGVGLSGLGVNGTASGNIHLSGIPDGAEALSAFLFWQVVSSDGPDAGGVGVTFDGQPLDSMGDPLAFVADTSGTAPCWSSGGGTGQAGGSKRTYTYRADVLRFLPIVDGRHRLNGDHQVGLPDQGNSNSTPRALGASLVVVYRSPDPNAPLSAVVIYDGSYTMDNATDGLSLTMKGFYDPLPVAGKMTHITGSAQANKNERLLVPGSVLVNPFVSADGASWDTLTVPTAPVSGDSVTTTVDHQGYNSFDCITWGAVVYRTAVRDTDRDGLLDAWEQATTPLVDPEGHALPNLNAMGANANRKDVFIELGYLDAPTDLTYGGVTKPAHTHLPPAEVLRDVGEAFANAPVSNPDGSQGISVHFDAGDRYAPGSVAAPYLVSPGLARGGEALDETATVCNPAPGDPAWVCQFSEYPGTVGWKSGFRFIRDGWVSPTGAPLSEADAAYCDTTGTCRQRFDRGREHIFRYVLFVHALGVPKADCLVDGFPDEACEDTNPLFHVPVTNTGVGDFPGGDAMVSMGGFTTPDGLPVGTDYMQAATLMHELGHTFQLRHGGALLEPNCKPNYLSVMNYLFQLRGLRDDAGMPHVDFSRQVFGGLDETNLPDLGGLGFDATSAAAPAFGTGWYAPLGPATLGTAATRHCNGSPILTDENGVPVEPPMVRVDSPSVAATASSLDWNLSGSADGPFALDLNFDGTVGALNAGFDDWSHVRLDQVGSRRNVGGWYWVTDPATGQPVAFMGPLSLDVGRGDLGRGDLGRGDLGRGDLGRGDLGRGDLGRGDLGRGDLGRGDLGRGDLGRGDLGRGDLGRGDLGRGDLGSGEDEEFELDADLAAASGYTPPNGVTALIVGLTTGCAGLSADDCHRVQVQWSSPSAGVVSTFTVWRASGGTATAIATIPAVVGDDSYSFVDGAELASGEYGYFVTATFADGAASGPSNTATIVVVNDAPVAGDDSYGIDQGTSLVVPAAGVLANDTDADSTTVTAQLVSGPVHGALALNADGSFTYTPVASFYGLDTFTYVATDGDPSRTSNVATVSITVNQVAVLYGFVGVQNIPAPNKPQKSGSSVPLKWQFTLNGVAVDSSSFGPVITITSGASTVQFSPEDPGSSSFKLPSAGSDWTWGFNWQTVNPATGAPLPGGSYTLTITLPATGQTFSGGTFKIK
ncbi:MAG: Ig-like domain-containing protein [Vicinamibacterales bacterium]